MITTIYDALLWTLLPAGFLIVLLALRNINKQQEKRKQLMLDRLGLEMIPDDKWQRMPFANPSVLFGTFILFRIGKNHRVTNVLRGTLDSLDLLVFDLSLTDSIPTKSESYDLEGNSRVSSTYINNRQTIAAIRLREELPRFLLTPKWLNFRHSMEPIKFDSHRFQQMYSLFGLDVKDIRQLFNQNLLDSLEKGSGDLCIEFNGEWIIITNMRRSLVNIEQFLATIRQDLLRFFGIKTSAETNRGRISKLSS